MMYLKFNSFYIFIFLITLIYSLSASADFYYYTDKDGVVHFTNIAPKGNDRNKFKIYLKTPPLRKAVPGIKVILPSDSNPQRYTRYDEVIKNASKTYLIPQALIKAVIKVESDYDPHVVSDAGAQGLMQLMPQTARTMGVNNVFDPAENIMGGTKYLRILANRFNGDLVLTLAGYNAGEGAVEKYGGVPPYLSTYKYVRKVLRFYYYYKQQIVSNGN